MYKKKRSFTVVELVVVAIIIGILAMVAMPTYQVTRERTLGNEARANLRLVAAAERIYNMEAGGAYPPAGTITNPATILSNLRVTLNENNWDYSITGGGGVNYSATAARNGTGGFLDCAWTVNNVVPEPLKNASCPQ